jgi:hypothetical protein
MVDFEPDGGVARGGPRWLALLVAALATAGLAAMAAATQRTIAADQAFQAYLAAKTVPEQIADLQRYRELRPDLSQGWRVGAAALSALSPRRARLLAAEAVRLNPRNWANWNELGLVDLQLGDTRQASEDMRRAGQLDRGFEAHFTLANLAWILGNRELFRRQMNTALRIAPPEDVGAALQDILRLGGGQADSLVPMLSTLAPDLQTSALTFLIHQAQLPAASKLWESWACPAYTPAVCSKVTTSLLNAWLAAAAAPPPPSRGTGAPVPAASPQAAAAAVETVNIWNRAVARGWLQSEPARMGWSLDSSFQHAWLGALSWHSDSGRLLLRPTGGAGAEVSVTLGGNEADHVPLFSLWVPVIPSETVRLFARARSSATPASGVTIALRANGKTLSPALALHLQPQWQDQHVILHLPSSISLVHLLVFYQRPYGQLLMRGSVDFAKVGLEPAAPPVAPLKSIP